MRAIIVDDEPLMIRHFTRLSQDIQDLNIIGSFESPDEALAFSKENPPDAAFLDVSMPMVSGIELAKKLRSIRPDILIIFVTAYEEYLWDFNKLGGDYYIVKPYDSETLKMAMDRIRLLAQRQTKAVYIQTFGRFLVIKNGIPLPLTGKAKELLALLVAKRGKEISNESIYNLLWEGRPYSNTYMCVYYNAIHRLRACLKAHGLESLLISTARGKLIDTDLFDCDYYAWMDHPSGNQTHFEGEFLSEYSWGEGLLANILNKGSVEE